MSNNNITFTVSPFKKNNIFTSHKNLVYLMKFFKLLPVILFLACSEGSVSDDAYNNDYEEKTTTQVSPNNTDVIEALECVQSNIYLFDSLFNESELKSFNVKLSRCSNYLSYGTLF